MGVGIPINRIDDFVETVLAEYERTVWSDLSLDNQNYTFAERFMGGGKGPRETPTAGNGYEWKVQVGNQSNAHTTGTFAEDRTQIINLMKSARTQMSQASVSFSYDVTEEAFQGDDATAIIDYIQVREHSMFNDWYEYRDNQLWSAPASQDADLIEMLGFPHWLQKSATEGFTGGNPAGWPSGCAGLNSTTYPRWKNRAGRYTAITRDDMVSRVLKHMAMCNFKPPHKYRSIQGQVGMPKYEMFTTYNVVEEAQRFLDSRNDNLRDMAGMAGMAKLASTDITWVAKLTNNDSSNATTYDATDPIYGIDFGTFQYMCLKGWKWKRHAPQISPKSHNVRNVFCDSIGQLVCTDRRRNFVIYRG